MRLIPATEQDSSRLTEFYNKQVVPGSLDLQFIRSSDFFGMYKLQSDEYVTYMLLDDKDAVQASATVLFRDAVLAGDRQIIGYATDLRVSQNRKAILSWAQHFLPVLEQERAARNCQSIFTSVMHGQKKAFNAFLRPKNIRRTMPRYYLFRNFEVITIHGRYPFSPKPLGSLRFRQALPDDLSRVANYVSSRSQKRPLSLIGSPEAFSEQLQRWQGLEIEDFLLALDNQGEIVGVVAPWKSHDLQKIIVTAMSDPIVDAASAMQFLSYLGWSKRLPPIGGELDLTYLCFLNADNYDVFTSLLQMVYRKLPKKGFMAYTQFEGDFERYPLQSQVHGRQKGGLYCLLSPSDSAPDFLRYAPLGPSPDLELPFL